MEIFLLCITYTIVKITKKLGTIYKQPYRVGITKISHITLLESQIAKLNLHQKIKQPKVGTW